MALRSEVGVVLHRGIVGSNPASGMFVAISAFVLYRQRNFGWPNGRSIHLSGKISATRNGRGQTAYSMKAENNLILPNVVGKIMHCREDIFL